MPGAGTERAHLAVPVVLLGTGGTCSGSAPPSSTGVFGSVVIDPPGRPGTPDGGGPQHDVEAMRATYDIDPSWRQYDHASER